jgi:hypothetical protein
MGTRYTALRPRYGISSRYSYVNGGGEVVRNVERLGERCGVDVVGLGAGVGAGLNVCDIHIPYRRFTSHIADSHPISQILILEGIFTSHVVDSHP